MNDLEYLKEDVSKAIGPYKTIIKTGLAVGTAAIIGLSSMHSTGTTEVGVKVNKIKGEIEQIHYQPGSTYFFPSIVNDWYTFDTKLQNLEMKLIQTEKEKQDNSLKFKAADGNDIGLDLTISYTIDPKKTPYMVEFVGQSNEEINEKIVKIISRADPRDVFGELDTQQFYTANTRNLKAKDAKDKLNLLLNPYGVIVQKIDTKDYRFIDKGGDYNKAIRSKKVADSTSLKLEAEIKAQANKNLGLLNQAQGEVNKQIATANGAFLQKKQLADAYFTQKSNEADSIRVEADSEAAGITKEREAMLSGGGETLVRMEIAKALSGKRIVPVPSTNNGGQGLDINTFDTNRFLETMGIQSMTEKSQTHTKDKK